MGDNNTETVLGLVSAIWILASNDEDERISYRGLAYRLHLASESVGRDLVTKHAELFRHGVPQRRVDSWKVKVRSSGKMPSWVRVTPEGTEREAVIDGLSPDDFFRSQFRAEEDAKRSPIEIVDWGLQHLERVYKAAAEKKEERSKRVSSLWIPLASLLVTLVALVTSAVIQWRAMSDQRELKQFEVSFGPKQEGYTSLMTGLAAAFDSAVAGNGSGSRESAERARRALFQLEPFLSETTRALIEEHIDKAMSYNERIAAQTKRGERISAGQIAAFADLRRQLKSTLYPALFSR